ncbi:hypothetical protein [Mucilaginibacter terrae]|uniref:DUF962 domain-containing protein n=1 Tax=Mucilaginibacter terrae TaxID=1955052 RepID=A0ABU3GYK9_9SPHI|nr:hypothetical protein [Mucilaginibacter terrae]MDT3404511.1 hypothetical protein [Mucilaginibacter terrae]
MPSKIEQRPVDRYFEEVGTAYNKNAGVAALFVLLMLFGLVTLVWALPFPHLAFLGKYNGYLNWASFLIAGLIYYLLRLSPMVSYLMLFWLFGFSYGIIQLEGWQKAGGPALWVIGFSVFAFTLAVQLFAISASKISKGFNFLFKAPVWVLVLLLKKLGLKY